MPDKDNALLKFGFKSILFLLLMIGLGVWSIPNPGEDNYGVESVIPEARVEDNQTMLPIKLYLPDSSRKALDTIEEQVSMSGDIETRIETILRHLFEHKNFFRLKREVFVRSVYTYKNNAVISLDGSFRKNFPGGAITELLFLYSICNTIVGAFESIESVQIIIDDRETEVLVAHVDIWGPVLPDLSFVAVPVEEEAEQKDE